MPVNMLKKLLIASLAWLTCQSAFADLVPTPASNAQATQSIYQKPLVERYVLDEL